MAANNQLPPIPNNPITDVFVWRDWFYQVSQVLTQQASLAWTSINFTGSNLRDIVTRQHNALQDIQGGVASQYYHLSLAQYNSLNSLLSPCYGAYQNTADQTYAVIDTPYIITLNTTDYASNQTLSSNRITVSTTGIYNLEFSFQLASTDTSIHEFAVWLRKNGTDVAGTSSVASVPNSHGGIDGYLIIAANFYINLTAGDYIELWSAVNNTNIRIDAIAAQTSPYARPLNPSSVVTLTQIA